MGIIIGVLAFLLVGGGIFSGILYSRQQAAAMRERQLKAISQKYEELKKLYDILFLTDDQPEVPALLNKALLGFARDMRKLDPKSPERHQLVEQHSHLDAGFSEGSLHPRGERLMNSDAALTSLLSSYAVIVQKLQRFKVRGMIATHQYEEYALHLRKLSLDTEVSSHLAFAEIMIGNSERLKAEGHLKHARECLKKTSLEIPDKAERIRELTDRIKNLENEIAQRRQAVETPDSTSANAPSNPAGNAAQNQ